MYKKLLFVDDQPDVLMVLERDFCRRPDVIIFSASSIDQAHEILKANEINVVVSDIRLGTESGYELARILRSDYPQTGLILTSGWQVKGNQHKAELLDVIFVAKPFKLQDLNDLVDTFLTDYSVPLHNNDREVRTEVDLPTSETVLTHFQPQDLVQLFCLNGKNVVLSIRADLEQPEGHIYIQKGKVVHAQYKNLWGEEAFWNLLNLQDPLLNIRSMDEHLDPTIETSWEKLLMQAAVRKDEESALVTQINPEGDYYRDHELEMD
jgi:CheY-like chemotaxis protein